MPVFCGDMLIFKFKSADYKKKKSNQRSDSETFEGNLWVLNAARWHSESRFICMTCCKKTESFFFFFCVCVRFKLWIIFSQTNWWFVMCPLVQLSLPLWSFCFRVQRDDTLRFKKSWRRLAGLDTTHIVITFPPEADHFVSIHWCTFWSVRTVLLFLEPFSFIFQSSLWRWWWWWLKMYFRLVCFLSK